MSEPYTFFLIFLGTIVFTRICLAIKPVSSPTIHGFKLHHYMYGIVLMIVGFFIQNMPMFAIGLGLFVDELPILWKREFHYKEYKSAWCRIGVVILITLIFLCRAQILSLIRI